MSCGLLIWGQLLVEQPDTEEQLREPLGKCFRNGAHIRGIRPVEEPSTASSSEVGARNRYVRFPPDSDQTADMAGRSGFV